MLFAFESRCLRVFQPLSEQFAVLCRTVAIVTATISAFLLGSLSVRAAEMVDLRALPTANSHQQVRIVLELLLHLLLLLLCLWSLLP